MDVPIDVPPFLTVIDPVGMPDAGAMGLTPTLNFSGSPYMSDCDSAERLDDVFPRLTSCVRLAVLGAKTGVPS